MTDYISRKAALVYAPLPKYLREYQTQNLDDAWEDGYFCALDQIRSIPAADVRPVVLCKDCTFFKPQQKSKRWSSTTPMCSRSATIKMPPDGFCSFGEKREES